MPEIYELLIVFGAGLIAGWLNTIAAGGSMLSLPILIFYGLPADVANATNRIGILFQNIVTSSTYIKRGVLNVKGTWKIIVPSTIGGIAGSYAVTLFSPESVKSIIGWIILVVSPLMFFNFGKVFKGDQKELGLTGVAEVIVFFAVGFYGGFIQAGVGIFLMIALSGVAKLDLVVGNALKVFIVLFYTIPVVIWFQINGLMIWPIGLNLALGNMLGGYLGARFSLKYGRNLIKPVLFIVLVVLAIKLSSITEILFGFKF